MGKPIQDPEDKSTGKPGKSGKHFKGNGSNKGKGGKSKPFQSGKGGKSGEETPLPTRNDPSYYTKYRTLSDTFAKIAFNHRNGSKVEIAVNEEFKIEHNVDPIVIMDYMMTPGNSLDLGSGINVSALNAYKVLNRRYRGSMTSRYESADFGIAQFAIVDFYISLAQAERAYGIAQVAKVNQRQIPRELLFALGYDADELMANLANFRASLNYLITRAQGLCLVKGYSLLDHHLFLMSNVFKDKDTLRGQYFAYRKPGFWKWNPTVTATGSALTWVDYNNTERRMRIGAYYHSIMKSTEVIIRLNEQLDALLGDSDIDAICADILAYFGNDDNSPNLVKLTAVPEAYAVEAIYDENVLKQFHNTTVPVVFDPTTGSPTGLAPKLGNSIRTPIPADIIPSGSTINDFTTPLIYQKNNTIMCTFEAPGSGNISYVKFSDTYRYVGAAKGTSSVLSEALLDTDTLEPSQDQIMEWTRNLVLTKELAHTSDAQTYYYSEFYAAFGSVVPLNFITYVFKAVGNNNRDSGNNIIYLPAQAECYIIGSYVRGTEEYTDLMKFDWCPIIYRRLNFPPYEPKVVGDLDNYVVFDEKLLRPIHNVSVLSEFHNPISDVVLKDE